MLTGVTPFGPLRPVKKTLGKWATRNEKKYFCKYWRTDIKVSYNVFRLSQFVGAVSGESNLISQHITITDCLLPNLECRPQEKPSTLLIWQRINHTLPLYKSLETYTVHRINEFFAIPKLSLGGVAITETDEYILLDSSYVIRKSYKRLLNDTLHQQQTQKFMKLSKAIAKSLSSSIAHEMFSGYMTRQLMRENQQIADLAAMLCNINKQSYMWQSHVMNTFPELASQLLFPGGGTYVTGRGDALLIQSCAVITDYQVFWNQSLDNLCYKLFPVQLNTSGSLQMRFLELSTRRLLNNSHTIPCATRQPFYIRDYANDFWKYDLKDGFTLTEIKGFVTRNTYVPLPKIATFNDRIVRHGTFSPHPTTLLSIVAAQERNLQQLEDIRSSGHGNILKGIAAGMSDAFDAVVHAGESIFVYCYTRFRVNHQLHYGSGGGHCF